MKLTKAQYGYLFPDYRYGKVTIKATEAKALGFKTAKEAEAVQAEIIDLREARKEVKKGYGAFNGNVIGVMDYCKTARIRPQVVYDIVAEGFHGAKDILTEVKAREAKIKGINAIIMEAQALRACYTWQPPQCANGRRDFEKKHSHDCITWEEGGHSFSARLDVTCSCTHIYVSSSYQKDGKYTNLTAIRNSYNRIHDSFFQTEEV